MKGLREADKSEAEIEWRRKRAEFAQRCREGYSPIAGEIRNFVEGYTPDGFDKQGRRVSFVERGESVFDKRSPQRFSEINKDGRGRRIS